MTDLHMHSIHSDGSCTASELLTMAQNTGLDLMSVTDHNKVGFYGDIMNTDIRSIFKGKIISGAEITTSLYGEVCEIIGYGFNVPNISSFIMSEIMPFEKRREIEYEMMYDKYTAHGIRLDIRKDQFDYLISLRDPTVMTTSRTILFSEIIKHPENDKFFLDINNKPSFDKTYRHEISNPQSPLYFDYSIFNPKPDRIIDVIHNAGGLAFLAHAFSYTDGVYDRLETICNDYDLDGLECWYSKFTKDQTESITNLCKKRGLYMSGGSDFHGKLRPGVSIGTGYGDLCVCDEEVHKWADRLTGL